MRIYNGKNSQIDLPLPGSDQRLTVGPKSVSGDFMPNKDFLGLIVSSYDESEIALIISGPFEVSMCSEVPSCIGIAVNSLEDAISRFSPKETPKVKVEVVEDKIFPEVPVVEDKKEEIPAETPREIPEEPKPIEAEVALKEEAPKKVTRRKVRRKNID